MSQTEELKRLKELVEQLKEENQQLVNRNMQLSDQLCMWYELRQRANWLKEEMLSDQRRMQRADLADDGELFAAIEARLEQNMSILTPDFDAVALAEMLGISQARLTKLFRQNSIYKSADNYLDSLRLIRAIQIIREHPEYGIAAVSEDAGFNSVRTFQRRMMEAVGMTPVEFRMMLEKGK